MTGFTLRSALALALLCTASLGADSGPTEKSMQWKAAEVLPAAIVSGGNSQVLNPVENDGYLNTYRLKSKKFGEIKVVSTATLYERIHEFDAIAQMEKLKGSQEFAKAVEGKAKNVVEGGVNLVTDPLGTAGKAVSGVGRMFRNIGNTLGGGAQAGGDDMLSEASGFSKAKRAYARKFGVDPYSRNSYLQDTLKEISRAGFLGGAVTSLGLGAIGGAAGTALQVSTTANSLADMVSTKSGQEVATYSSDTLKKMGVDDDLADLFLRNENFTTTERAGIVMALEAMPTTQNRQAIIKFAVLTHDPDVAAFRRRQVDLYCAFNKKQKPIQEFVFLEQFAAARLQDGSMLLMAPVDHLLWTEEIAAYVGSVNQRVTPQAGARKLLWLSGTASPLALRNLTGSGWQVQQKAADRLK